MTTEYVYSLFLALDSLGMSDALPTARAHYARIADLNGESTTGHLSAEQDRLHLAGQVARGEISLTTAAEQTARLGPWTVRGELPSPAAWLADSAVREVHRMMEAETIAGSRDLYEVLVARAATAADRASTAAAAAVDMPALMDTVLKLVNAAHEEARQRGTTQVSITIGGSWTPGGDHLLLGGALAPDKLADVNGDVRRAGGWRDALAATHEFIQVHAAARLLREINRRRAADPEAMLYGVPTIRGARIVVEQLPKPLQLVTATALGWKPGLYGEELFAKPEPRRSLASRILAPGRR